MVYVIETTLTNNDNNENNLCNIVIHKQNSVINVFEY